MKLLNGDSLTRDRGMQSLASYILNVGIRKNYLNECSVGAGSVNTGELYIEVTRDNVVPNETFIVPVEISLPVAVDTVTDGFVICRIPDASVNIGSGNPSDGGSIALIEHVAVLPTKNFLQLASITGGLITQGDFASIKRESLNPVGEYPTATGTGDDIEVAIDGIPAYVNGLEICWQTISPNTGAVTVNLNGLGQKDLRKTGSDPLVIGDLEADQFVCAIYDATDDVFEMTSQRAQEQEILFKASSAEAIAGVDDAKYITPKTLSDTLDDVLDKDIDVYVSGDILSIGDLVYLDQTTKKVRKVTGTPESWSNIKGIVMQNAFLDDFVKVAQKGYFNGTFPDLTYKFDNWDGTSDGSTEIGDNALNDTETYVLDNTLGYEIQVSQLDIFFQNTITGRITASLSPIFNSNTGVLNGDDILATITMSIIPTMTLRNVLIDFTIPANTTVYLHIGLDVQGGGPADIGFIGTLGGNLALQTNAGVPTPAIGQFLKAWEGTDGTYGLGELGGVNQSPTVGIVISPTQFYLDVTKKEWSSQPSLSSKAYGNLSPNNENQICTLDIGYRPSIMKGYRRWLNEGSPDDSYYTEVNNLEAIATPYLAIRSGVGYNIGFSQREQTVSFILIKKGAYLKVEKPNTPLDYIDFTLNHK